ncbi:MAG: NAD(P)H-hydrate dehydratase [Spirochaetes bacterium]|nr:NAD(P)H-hydrate dehydratase [Spirochaetota bacterium]
MKPLVDFAVARELDARIVEGIGVPSIVLMEDAAVAMTEAILARVPGGTPRPEVTALCGGGGNAGDALAVCRLLSFRRGYAISVVRTKSVPCGNTAVHLRALDRLNARIFEWSKDREACEAAIAGAGILIDGLSGIGLCGSLADEAAEIVETLRSAGGTVFAVDVPSGLGDGRVGTLVRSDYTLCVEPLKSALYRPAFREACGNIVPVPGVFPEANFIRTAEDMPECGLSSVRAELLEEKDLPSLVRPVSPSAHKYDRGAVAVFAGAVGSTGAAIMASEAVQACAGLVTLFVRPELWPICASRLVEPMVKPEGEKHDFSRFSAICVGPGWGLDPSRDEIFASVWDSGLPLVLDADGLRILKRMSPGPRNAPLVLTPHLGELSSLMDVSQAEVNTDPYAAARQAAGKYGCIVVAKSHVTWIVAVDGPAGVFDGMTPSLAVGGSGDILAGLLAGLLADGSTPVSAARAAVLAHGMAGKRLAGISGYFPASLISREAGSIIADARRRASMEGRKG